MAAKKERGVRGMDSDWMMERVAAAVAHRWRCCGAEDLAYRWRSCWHISDLSVNTVSLGVSSSMDSACSASFIFVAL